MTGCDDLILQISGRRGDSYKIISIDESKHADMQGVLHSAARMQLLEEFILIHKWHKE